MSAARSQCRSSGEIAAAQEDEGDAELAGLVRGIEVEGLGELAEGAVGIALLLEGDGPVIEAGLGLGVGGELLGKAIMSPFAASYPLSKTPARDG